MLYISLVCSISLAYRLPSLQGALRIAHCGGYHGEIDLLIDAVNIVAKLLGHPIHWDSETIGCNPSLSSIPVKEQRTFLSALEEIAAWQAQPGNEQEFLVLYLDDQADLGTWVSFPVVWDSIHTASAPTLPRKLDWPVLPISGRLRYGPGSLGIKKLDSSWNLPPTDSNSS